LLKQKTNAETAFTNEIEVTAVSEEDSAFANLSTSLTEIRKLKGVIGYIIRSNTSAIIDLEDSENIFQYALLTSEIHGSSLEMANQFDLGAIESVLLEGEKIKVLCLIISNNKISVFMEKSANHASIIKRILL
jgi:predicted regulator of Ras-like GTPase activity (Roadblock/LC7/MglB family)